MARIREFRTPGDFWFGMVEPDFAECEANKADLRAAFHAAISLFHIHDWVWETHSDAIRTLFTYKDRDDWEHPVSSAGSFANALEQQYPDFGRIRGIANAVKHLELRDVRPVDNAARHATDTAVHVPGAGLGGYNVGNYGYGTPGLSYAGYPRVMLAGSNDMEFFKVAEAVRQMWIDLRGVHAWW
jgi:hypothetical protein